MMFRIILSAVIVALLVVVVFVSGPSETSQQAAPTNTTPAKPKTDDGLTGFKIP